MTCRIKRTATIDVSEDGSLSGAVEDLKGFRVEALEMPSSFDGTEVTFEAAAEKGGTYSDVHDDAGNELSVAVGTDQYVALSSDTRECFPFGAYGIKVRSGTSSSPTTESSDRTIGLVLTR